MTTLFVVRRAATEDEDGDDDENHCADRTSTGSVEHRRLDDRCLGTARRSLRIFIVT